jgi:TonB family protein
VISDKKRKKRSNTAVWIVSFVIVGIITGVGVFLARIIISEDGGKMKRQIHTISLLKPPPVTPKIPEKIPENIPEHEIRKENVMEHNIEGPRIEGAKPDDTQDQSQNKNPPGQDLGVDAEGTAGSDGFGLVGRKGGRALIGGGGGGSGSLTGQYAWYTHIVQEEIKKTVRERLEKIGGIPKGKLQIVVKIELNQQGKIIQCSIDGSSGNEAADQAVKDALTMVRVSEPPPDGMPRAMKLRISSQG